MLQEKFWTEDFKQIFSSSYIIPMTIQTYPQQLNCLSRLIVVVFIFLLLLKFNNSILFLGLSLIFIIILYYIQKRMSYTKENYINTTYSHPNYLNNTSFQRQKRPVEKNNVEFSQPRYDINTKILNFNELDMNEVSQPTKNQRLVGTQNPKTLIKPLVIPSPADLDYWRANNLVIRSGINDQIQQDDYLSGYTTTCNYENQYQDYEEKIEKYQNQREYSKTYNKDNLSSNTPDIVPYMSSTTKTNEGFEYVKNGVFIDNDNGSVNKTCGYDINNPTKYNLAVNDTVGLCFKDTSMKDYNRNLRTQTIQPNVYTFSEINEPINSNMGISFTQQIPPVKIENYSNGDVYYTEQNPETSDKKTIEPYESFPVESNVYDPRFYGYGTSYRSYIEPVTDQPRFMYDDINSIRMPNYVIRSKIDHIPEVEHYGPMQDNYKNGNDSSELRNIVHDAWLNSSIQFRNDLTTSYMRKRNNELAQMRSKPLGPRMI